MNKKVIFIILFFMSLSLNGYFYVINYIDVRLADKPKYEYLFPGGIEYDPVLGPNLDQYLRFSYVFIVQDKDKRYNLFVVSRDHCKRWSTLKLSEQQIINLNNYIDKPIIINQYSKTATELVLEDIEFDSFAMNNIDNLKKACNMIK